MPASTRCIPEILDTLNRVLLDKPEVTEKLLTAFLAGGHVLIEDIPGVGKTTIAKAFATVLGLSFGRIQFTPDLMPSDITGSSILDPADKRFVFREGPIFSQLVLADEVNRSSPKTQSALLEAMEERQVSCDGTTYRLAEPFMVIATQNPVEYHGTFPLPEAQLDRFMFCLTVGYPGYEHEIELSAGKNLNPAGLVPLLDDSERSAIIESLRSVTTTPAIHQYAVNIVSATRNNPDFLLGASPRASIDLIKAGKALACIRGRDYVLPDDLKELAPALLGHRLILSAEARMENKQTLDLVRTLLGKIYVPKHAAENYQP